MSVEYIFSIAGVFTVAHILIWLMEWSLLIPRPKISLQVPPFEKNPPVPSLGHFSSLWPFLHIFSNKKRHRRKTEELLQQKSDEILKARKIIDGFHNSGHDSWVLYNLRSQCGYFCIFLHFVCWLAATLRQNSWNYLCFYWSTSERLTFWPYQLDVNMRSQGIHS